MKIKNHIISFPCSFPIKVMGLNTKAFSSAVLAIFHEHMDPDPLIVTSRLSSGDKYLSITVTINARSQDQLDAIYRALNDHELVMMTL